MAKSNAHIDPAEAPAWKTAIVLDASAVVLVEQPPRSSADAGVWRLIAYRCIQTAGKGSTVVWACPEPREVLRWMTSVVSARTPKGYCRQTGDTVIIGGGRIIVCHHGAIESLAIEAARMVVLDRADLAGVGPSLAALRLRQRSFGRLVAIADGPAPKPITEAASVHRVPDGAAVVIDKPAGGLLDWISRHLPAYATLPFSRMHARIAADLDAALDQRGSWLAYPGPRGVGKSVILEAAVMRAALEGWEPYILYASESLPLAQTHLESIRRELEDNATLAEAYPSSYGPGPTWHQERLQLRNGVVIEPIGTSTALRGRRNRTDRPSMIVLDDPQGDKGIYSAREREKALTWFDGTLMRAGSPDTNVVCIGNNLHRECIVSVVSQRPTWRGETFRTIEEWPDRMDLWGQWEAILTDGADPEREKKALAFYVTHALEMTKGAKLLWSERFPLYDLMVERADSGHAAFERERQSNPISPDLTEWPEDAFAGNLYFDEWPANDVRVIAIDPSKGKDAKRGDYSAIVSLAVGRHDGLLYVDADLARRPGDQIFADALTHWQHFRPHTIGMESVGFQEWGRDELQRQAVERKLILPVTAIEADAPKIVRIRRLTPYVTNRRLRFKRGGKGVRLLLDQLRDFPAGAHDDGPDALEMAVRLALGLINGRESS